MCSYATSYELYIRIYSPYKWPKINGGNIELFHPSTWSYGSLRTTAFGLASQVVEGCQQNGGKFLVREVEMLSSQPGTWPSSQEKLDKCSRVLFRFQNLW